MEFSLIELNELIYAVGTASRYGNLVDKKIANRLWARLNDELESRMKLYDTPVKGPEDGPEYDSSGFTEDDRIVNGQYNVIKDPIGGGE
jgi:hypothetical protein